MADVTYLCEVNKTHMKKVPDFSKVPPYCCGKIMAKMQATPTAASSKPQSATPTTTAKPVAASAAANAPKPQGLTQGTAGKTGQQPPKK